MDKNLRRKSQIQRRPNQYNNSSEAYDYVYTSPNVYEKSAPSYDELNRRLNERKQAELKKKQMLRQQRAIMRKQREQVKKDRINHLLCYILAVYILGIGVFILYQSDQNNLIKSQISKKQAIINEQAKQISAKKIILADSIDIHEIDRIAKEELGMKVPSTDQIVYVTLPKNISYIEYRTTPPQINKNEEVKAAEKKTVEERKTVEKNKNIGTENKGVDGSNTETNNDTTQSNDTKNNTTQSNTVDDTANNSSELGNTENKTQNVSQ